MLSLVVIRPPQRTASPSARRSARSAPRSSQLQDMNLATSIPTPESTIFFLCDIQTSLAPSIHGIQEVVFTTNKMLKIAKLLGCEVLVTEQYPQRLGSTVPEVDLQSLGPLCLPPIAKTSFSMLIPAVQSILSARSSIKDIILVGIETHVCVLQSALDLLSFGYNVHILADGVSSSNKEEIPIALARIRQAGGLITTSESIAFQLFRNSTNPNFRAFSSIIKEEKEGTAKALQVLQPRSAL